MGQLLQAITNPNPNPTINTKHSLILPDLYCLRGTTQAGRVVTRISDGARCFILHKELQQSAVSSERERQLKEWLDNSYSHSCNIIQYEIRSRSLLCNSQVTLKVLLEYGQTIHEMLEIDGKNLDRSQLTCGEEPVRFESPVQRMKFVKAMLDAAEQQKQKNGHWVAFHTKSMVYFPTEKTFKLFYLLSLEDSAFSESFFAPEVQAGHPVSQWSCVFSMGMVLLSLFLGEDCSDCYNYQNYTFCESIFQDKVERLRESMVTRGLIGILDDHSRYVPQFEEEVSELILLMIAPQEERLCFAEVKRRYLCLILKAPLSYASSEHHRSALHSLTSKRAAHRRTNTPHPHLNIGCFSTNEDLHFRTTITQADQSQFFAFSKSNIRAKGIDGASRLREGVCRGRESVSQLKEASFLEKEGLGGKDSLAKRGKDNQALRWKRAITSKMREHKENLPYYQQL